MELGWLEDFLALRELGSFTAAAERRNISQSAFSRRIQSLEDWLGVTLIDRSVRPHRFTPVATETTAISSAPSTSSMSCAASCAASRRGVHA